MRLLIYVATLLVSNVASAETLLMLTPIGYYVCEVTDGVPGNWVPLEDWSGFGQVIKSNGSDTVPPSDAIAVEVDKWTDDVNDTSTRPRWASAWNQVISDVESGKIDFADAEQHIDVRQVKIIEALEPRPRAGWVIWNSKVSNLIDNAKRRGDYTIKTLTSIHKGLVGL